MYRFFLFSRFFSVCSFFFFFLSFPLSFLSTVYSYLSKQQTDLAVSSSGDVLSLWLLRRVSAFVDQLKTLLPLVEDGGLLRSLLEEVGKEREA